MKNKLSPKLREITFKGRKYLLVGTVKDGGAIATKRQYENGILGYAHLNSDGSVYRLGKQIGNRKDVKCFGWVTVNPKPIASVNPVMSLLEILGR